MAYDFTTNLLSAEKTGSPNLIGTSLSGVGVSFLSGNNVVFATQQVVVVSLSTTDVGIAFNPVTITVGATSLSSFQLSSYPIQTVSVLGSVFRIPAALNTSTFAVVETTPRGYTTFTWLSATTTVAASAITETRDVTTANSRRLRLYGYY